MRDVLGWNGNDRQPVRPCVVLPLASEHYLKMGHGIAGDLAAYPIKAQVCDMVLSATVKAAADLDVQGLDGFVGDETVLADPLPQFSREPARRRNTQLAGISAWARDYI